MLAVGAGHMLREGGELRGVAARMSGDALALVEDLHDASASTHI